jgi:arylsulfatase A-like enzyme
VPTDTAPSVDTAPSIDTAPPTDTAPTDTGPPPPPPPNVLLVISDDLGIEGSACYDPIDKTERAPQPTIEGLCSQGLVFDAAWSYPMCSPTRSAMLTGRAAWRTGIGYRLGEDDPPLSMNEETLPEVIDAAGLGYSHANIGKWHLGEPGDLDYPNQMGWGHFAGMLGGTPTDYLEGWTKVVDGEEVKGTGYLTSETIDDALSWLGEQEDPWVLWLALNAPHTPFHAPPDDLHDYTLSGDPDDDPFSHYLAAIQAMDTELARLLEGIDAETLANTYIIYISDNGALASVNQEVYASNHAKASLYQGGVQVPMVVVGPGVVAGERVSGLVQVTDLYPTILELVGAEPALGVELDGVSIVPMLSDPNATVRDIALIELFSPEITDQRAGRAARDARFKLVQHTDGVVRFFDLEADPFEEVGLSLPLSIPDQGVAYQALTAALEATPKKQP